MTVTTRKRIAIIALAASFVLVSVFLLSDKKVFRWDQGVIEKSRSSENGFVSATNAADDISAELSASTQSEIRSSQGSDDVAELDLFQEVEISFVDQAVLDDVISKSPDRYRFVKVNSNLVENLVNSSNPDNQFSLEFFPDANLVLKPDKLIRYEEGQRAGFSFASGKVVSQEYSSFTMSSAPNGSVYIRVRGPSAPRYFVEETSQPTIHVVREVFVKPIRID